MNFLLLSFASLTFVNEIICFGHFSIFTVDQDAFRNVTELITSKGYPVESYTVQTFDDYLLSVQRIPYGRKGPVNSGKQPVVFLMHGLEGDSSHFVWNFPEQSLGFVLADNGYDVWLGNTRGNRYSRNHAKLSPDSKEFWDYSLDEMIMYDLPAMIDFALDKTGQMQLSFIGHSQGTTSAFSLLSLSPEYNKKIKLFIALSPVVKLGHMKGLYGLLTPVARMLQPFYKSIGLVEFTPPRKILDIFKVVVCGSPARFICAEMLFSVIGRDTKQLNYTRIPTYLGSMLSGASTKSIIHFAQMAGSNKLQMYDYRRYNKDYYNQDTPPVYDVSKITTPTVLMSGLNDAIAPPSELDELRPMLNSVVSDYVVPYAEFNHNDFIFAMDAYPLVYKKVLSLLQQYNNN